MGRKRKELAEYEQAGEKYLAALYRFMEIESDGVAKLVRELFNISNVSTETDNDLPVLLTEFYLLLAATYRSESEELVPQLAAFAKTILEKASRSDARWTQRWADFCSQDLLLSEDPFFEYVKDAGIKPGRVTLADYRRACSEYYSVTSR